MTIRATTAAAATLLSVAGAVAFATPASAAPRDVLVRDRTGDGTPDITSMSITHASGVAARVKVQVRGVRMSVMNEMTLYVDPDGTGRRPRYAFVLGLNGGGEWGMLRTDGWRLGRSAGTCGERIRLREPSSSTRVVVFSMPYACFGDSGATFAARAAARDRRGALVGRPDWTPATRTLSRRFAL